MNNQYKVFRQTYFDKDGREGSYRTYFIKQRKVFLGIEWWAVVKHKESGYYDSYMTKTTFPTAEKAEAFIKDVLCPGVPRNKFVTEEVKSIGCQS